MGAATAGAGRARVLYCEGNTDGSIGGSYFSLLFLLEGLAGSEFEPVVVFHREHPLLPDFRRVAEVHVVEPRGAIRLVPDARSRSPWSAAPRAFALGVQRGVNAGGLLLTVAEHARFLTRQKIDLLHLNNSVTRSHEWMIAAMLTRTPWVVHERGINTRFSPLATRLAPRAAAVICISEAVRHNLLEHGVARENLHVIPNGIDPGRVLPGRSGEAVRSALGIGDRPVIGMVGNIKEWKGQEVVVRALPRIARSVPSVVCLLVGMATEADRAYAERLHSLVADLGLGDRVIFTGYSENVADYLAVMEVAIHASVAPEPFGRVLLEAMAMGKPVVGSRSGAVPEIVSEGETGFTFSPGRSEELADRVVTLLRDRELAAAFGRAGRARVAERFSISSNVSRTSSLYGGVLRNRARS